ncbi:uncharacterized protein VTP21DRAFT_8121 [Calcarisporiella thermophila]|uniref:uncharacterized protein n=1 Tax=Calcarisporiella thermophila TaxID=911321 RepID=UPI0037437E2C
MQKSFKKTPKLTYFHLYRYAGISRAFAIVWLWKAVATISSIGDPNLESQDMFGVIMPFLGIVISVMLSSYLQNCFWSLAGENQTKRIRELYFHSILHQDQSWFDLNQSESLNTRLSADTLLIQEGLSEKVGFLLKDISYAIASFTLAFYYGWRLSIVLLAIVPMLIFSGFAFAYVLKGQIEKVQNAYSSAGTLVEQCISGIRTITAFSMQQHFIELFNSYLNVAYRAGIRKAMRAVPIALLFGMEHA